MAIKTPLAGLEGLVSVVVLAFLLVLILIWWRQYRQTKARFSLGLVVFAVVLFLKEGIDLWRVAGKGSDLPVIGPRLQLLATIGEAIALGVLLYQVAR